LSRKETTQTGSGQVRAVLVKKNKELNWKTHSHLELENSRSKILRVAAAAFFFFVFLRTKNLGF
jgi:hypothetical protein